MSFHAHIAAGALLLVSALPVEAGLPPRVAERLDQAVDPTQPDEFAGRFTMSITSVVQKPNGKSREEMEFEAEVENPGDGSQTRHLVRFVMDGTDVTEKQREDFEGKDDSEKNSDDDSDLANPFGETADHYLFGDPQHRESEIIVTFKPAPDHEDDADVAQGSVAWDPVTQEPRWLEMEAIHPPKPLKKLVVRLEFVRHGDDIFISRMVTDGLAKILLMQREFHMELRFKDIRPKTTTDQ